MKFISRKLILCVHIIGTYCFEQCIHIFFPFLFHPAPIHYGVFLIITFHFLSLLISPFEILHDRFYAIFRTVVLTGSSFSQRYFQIVVSAIKPVTYDFVNMTHLRAFNYICTSNVFGIITILIPQLVNRVSYLNSA